ncbi:MAG: type Z 30S ribosomal protein S14 [Candidatus Moeniiplasma glomeromycotorum]|nr:type Z 30S ribosomal protein S14 [Candidatus Moeniiplasma glomeromycotorum]MCE8167056.1 type Z 30S ribosomal protein S14 [Candidatus Moeniiplasma glomeromycotorum]MCE8168932.1 type Z 30S ribosomal protein S14 [Candidatus Moeniiplasma glomeromycotorum]
MATKAQKVKTTRPPKYSTQKHNRCIECFRHNLIRFGLCRICFKLKVDQGELPGFTKD